MLAAKQDQPMLAVCRALTADAIVAISKTSARALVLAGNLSHAATVSTRKTVSTVIQRFTPTTVAYRN